MAERRDRRHDRDTSRDDGRSPFEHDRDRILYSTAFRRLGSITQVVAPTERQIIHNRLTHSLEVAQIGRGLANSLLSTAAGEKSAQDAGGLDPTVVEAASLAHDLGHPPFGHVAESELNILLTDAAVADGYEGNAQSFRIVSRLAVRFVDIPRLNLTRATMAAILKYPWKRGEYPAKPDKWGAYEGEAVEFNWARAIMPAGSHVRSLEAALMDWADDVAYAVHDLEDFFRAGLIPLDRLAIDTTERERFLLSDFKRRDVPIAEQDEQTAVFDHLMEISPFSRPFTGTHTDRALLRSFTSSMVNDYIHATSLRNAGNGAEALEIDPVKEVEVALLKGLTWHYVINSQALVSLRFGQRQVIRSLFAILAGACKSEIDLHLFPPFFREQLVTSGTHEEKLRIVADCIASMSEGEAVESFHRLSGLAFGSSMDRLV